ncbi:DUF4336 domain-containing protein [Halomonas sp. HP20-15]|uniref:DUF4336 domain-containing protein n=1 Tax=Halomonas sp. HP20-15 TaxID=3085901 RepID=UPI002982B1D6|nr:DUF4336 domain-containing protein [Halomonas sp. HP20-15]MDW5375375.1 DUF4336 domain-containing protein [Halomonas sp. HP20-15]
MADYPTGYEPLYNLKAVAPDIWIVDGSWVRFYGIPFPTRMTIVRLSNGDVWVHSPIAIHDELDKAISTIGPVRYLIAPNWIHYSWVPIWQKRFPGALTFVSPGVVERAVSRGVQLLFDEQLSNESAAYWTNEIDQRIAESGYHREVVFFHRATRTLILTDLIENFEKHKMPWWTRPLLKLGGVCAPNGGMPRDMAASFKRRREHLSQLVMEMISWKPDRIILAHGKWFESNGVRELKRAFRKFLV